ncbi:hypothetical protein [Streptomyces sp. NPDC050704]|uniref:hypothetical protein n=1 Tax=Streptomyces sp. NPDC050704 TaxID=3157219 RepID=UPI003447208C
MSDQPVFVLGEGLQALEPAGFETEAEFQELLARHPRVLDFGSLSDGRPLRLTLVAREMGVASGAESGPSYWLDHLFVDADAVPTLVEVKRATDTRIRREVVGQMLDYAANGARYWPAALLQRSFEETCAADGRPLEEAYAELLGERAPEDFWSMVEERLAVGQMRLLFVADRIPLELRAIVEFLNGQMRQTDVYAVELSQYRGEGQLRVLVPRVHGEVATAAKSSSARRSSKPATTRAEMDAALQERFDEQACRAIGKLLDHAAARGRLQGGTGNYPSMSLHYSVDAGERPLPVGTVSLYNEGRNCLAFNVGSISRRIGVDATAAFAELLPDVGGLGKMLEEEKAKGFTGWKEISLEDVLARPGALDTILAAIEQFVTRP